MPDEVSGLEMLRRIRRVTQQELADAIGVSETTIRNWEKGRATPQLTIPQMKSLCKVLDVKFEDLPDSFAPQPIHTHDPAVKITTYPDV